MVYNFLLFPIVVFNSWISLLVAGVVRLFRLVILHFVLKVIVEFNVKFKLLADVADHIANCSPLGSVSFFLLVVEVV